jgi:hypothetical protein
MGGACCINREKRNVHRLLVEKPEGAQDICGWINIKVDSGETGWGGVDCIGLAQDRDHRDH